MNNIKQCKTIHNGQTAIDVINAAIIIKTRSNDYLLRAYDRYDLDINDDDNLVITEWGYPVCTMYLDLDAYQVISARMREIDNKYSNCQI